MIKFGSRQIGNPTPEVFDKFVKIWVGITSLFLAWMPTNNIVGHHAQDLITPITNLLNSVLLFLLPFFGVTSDSGRKTVPLEDVKVIGEHEKKTPNKSKRG